MSRIRIRLLTDDQDLMGLPWASISHRGIPLRDSGWTLELGLQPNEGEAPRLASHSLAMPGPVLVAVTRALRWQEHVDDLRGLIRALWPKRSAIFEVQDLEDLELELRERSPRLLYWFGPGRWDRATGSYTLELDTRDGTTVEVGLPDIAAYFSNRPPQVCFFNLVDDLGCRGMDFGRQAAFFLAKNAFSGSHCCTRGPVRLYPETRKPKDVETSSRRFHQLGPNADLFAPLRTQAGGLSGDRQVPLLCWVLEQDENTSAKALA